VGKRASGEKGTAKGHPLRRLSQWKERLSDGECSVGGGGGGGGGGGHEGHLKKAVWFGRLITFRSCIDMDRFALQTISEPGARFSGSGREGGRGDVSRGGVATGLVQPFYRKCFRKQTARARKGGPLNKRAVPSGEPGRKRPYGFSRKT